MAETKFTPGPWIVTHEERWPFGIAVEPNVLQMSRIAYSTKQKTLQDVRDATWFPFDEVENVAGLVAEQEANANLIAAAPDLYAALDAMFDEEGGFFKMTTHADADMVRAALRKARGEA